MIKVNNYYFPFVYTISIRNIGSRCLHVYRISVAGTYKVCIYILSNPSNSWLYICILTYLSSRPLFPQNRYRFYYTTFLLHLPTPILAVIFSSVVIGICYFGHLIDEGRESTIKPGIWRFNTPQYRTAS